MKAITKERANQLIYECTRFCETPKDRLELATKIEQSLCVVHTRNAKGDWDVEPPKGEDLLFWVKNGESLLIQYGRKYNMWLSSGVSHEDNCIIAWCEVPTLPDGGV